MLEPYPRLPVTDEGVFIPKTWLGEAKEVELRAVNGEIFVVPVGGKEQSPSLEPYSPEDPIWQFGKNPVDGPLREASGKEPALGPVPADDPLWRLCDDPVDDDITDASINLDKYLYGGNG
jgi:hypothetical protein